jgi:hypothetical protein
MNRTVLRLLVRAWITIAMIDFAYASLMSTLVYNGTFRGLWQGVASVPLGPSAMQGGTRTVLIGLLMHACVALLWTSVFMVLALALPALRRIIASPGGIVAVACVYGPVIWMMMSLVLIPAVTGRPPTITSRWFIALAGHIVFVALPIVATIGRGLGAQANVSERPVVSVA